MIRATTNIYLFIKDLIVSYRRIAVTLIHLVHAFLANYLAFILRFESLLLPQYFKQFLSYMPILLLVRLIFYLRAGLYKDLWRYSSVSDLIKIVKAIAMGSIVFLVIVRYLVGDLSYPRSIYILDCVLLIMISGGTRLFIRIFKEYVQVGAAGKRTLIIGAGDAGEMIVRDMRQNYKNAYVPIGFIDDDSYKKGLTLHGLPIFGPGSTIEQVIERERPDEVLLAIPSASHKTIKKYYELCKPFGIPIKTLPGLKDILDGSVSVSQIRPLSLEDLLQREPVRTDIESVRQFIEGKSVLVTGAGGSIGSELSRQIIQYNPRELILFDRYENGLYGIDLELQKEKQDVKVSTIVGDMRDILSLEHLFTRHNPQIVFHAAAHKHVPLMEQNSIEAVKNNIFGTKNLLDCSTIYGAESFVMISTDKAVNPTNIMGATKRVAEFLTIGMNSSATKYNVVRFGNVLGSNGSVVHVFKEQIRTGGPVTVTHPDMRRFFMLIPEAVQLVLMAASGGNGGEIFVLDMGEPIKIVDFAENLISLSGFVPHEDIEITFTGLRPGEKLYEELFDESEMAVQAFHDKLQVAVPRNVPSPIELGQYLAMLENIVQDNLVDNLIPTMQQILPGFRASVIEPVSGR